MRPLHLRKGGHLPFVKSCHGAWRREIHDLWGGAKIAEENVQPQKVLQKNLGVSLTPLAPSTPLLPFSQGKAWCLSMVTVDLWPSWLWP